MKCWVMVISEDMRVVGVNKDKVWDCEERRRRGYE